jgi:hypothetical protein
MNKLLGTVLMTAALTTAAGAAQAAAASEQRGIDARIVKVKLGGVINLKIKQGAAPTLIIKGEREDIARVSVVQAGDLLIIDTRNRDWTFGSDREELRVELTLPALSELSSTGVGATSVQGFTGHSVKLDLDGAGAITVDGSYRQVKARLGGVGSMTLNAGNSDEVDLKLRGAGHVAINGNSKLLRADLGGVGSLDARKLQADAVELDMSGLGGATVYARNSANLTLSGLGSATVYGNPATRTEDKRGMGSIAWKQ